MPELDQSTIEKIAKQEILPKTLAFCPALTAGELDDTPRLSAVATAVGLMYWGDQTMDRGDMAMVEAITLLHNPEAPSLPRLTALRHIEEKITALAKPEDAPPVLACFYDQVLHHEVVMQQLSRDYLASGGDPAFIAGHAALIAETATISAGFPSVASSLYAIYRHHDASLPPLSEIYDKSGITDLLQACNVVVRLWDELGDWEMDTGDDPDKGIFVINPFNQYHPAVIQRFCELAQIHDATQITALQQAFAEFHASDAARQKHGAYILKMLRHHIRDYITGFAAGLPSDVRARFDRYLILCRRVLEIGYVNRIGDIALAAPEAK